MTDLHGNLPLCFDSVNFKPVSGNGRFRPVIASRNVHGPESLCLLPFYRFRIFQFSDLRFQAADRFSLSGFRLAESDLLHCIFFISFQYILPFKGKIQFVPQCQHTCVNWNPFPPDIDLVNAARRTCGFRPVQHFLCFKIENPVEVGTIRRIFSLCPEYFAGCLFLPFCKVFIIFPDRLGSWPVIPVHETCDQVVIGL